MAPPLVDFVDVNVSLAAAAADKFSFGTLLLAADHSVTANRQDGPYSSVAAAVSAGFTLAAVPNIFNWVTAAFAQENGVDQVLIGRTDVGGVDANLTAALNAIEADDPTAYYILNIESRVEADVLDAAAWTEAREKIYIAQSLDADILDGTASSVALALQAFGYNRTALIYHATSTGTDGYLDGAWSSRGGGLNLDAPNGVGIWAYKQLSGVTFDDVSEAEAAEIFAADANLYGRLKGLSFTSKGTMASGRFIDVQTSLDWIKVRCEEAVLSAFVGTPTKIPYTDAGINMLKSAVQSVLDQGVSFGHLSPDEPPVWTVPRVTEVSDADKLARLLTMSVTVTLAGAIQKLVLNITVQP